VKVLHVVAALAPRYGGPSVNVPGICHATRAAGVDAEIATTDADGADAALTVPLGERITWQGVPVRFFRRSFSERYKYSRGLGRWLSRSAKDYDLVVAHGCFSYAPEAAADSATRALVPHLFVPHGMLSEFALRGRPFKRGYLLLRTRLLIRGACGVVCTSSDEEAEVRAAGVEAPVARVLWGVDEMVIGNGEMHAPEWRKSVGIPPNKRIILFLGRLHPKKGLFDQVFPALARLDSAVILVVAGSEDAHAPGYAGELRREAARLGLSERVHLIGPVYGEAKTAALDACDVFVLASHDENLGSAVSEAMGRGRPVVVSNRVQLWPEVASARAGFVVPLDPVAVANAIRQILRDPEGARQMGKAGRELVRTRLTWELAATRLKAFYEDVIARGRTDITFGGSRRWNPAPGRRRPPSVNARL
jgi:glycosyltransferase involved in cell wall biosynthesis